MPEIASARINTFGSKSPQSDLAPPDDPILEIPLSEFQALLEDSVSVFNQISEMVRDAGILRGKDLARMVTRASESIKTARSPTEKILLLNAFTKQLVSKLRDGLKSRPKETGKIIQVCTKIMARAVQIIDYIKTTVGEDQKRKEIALDSQQARMLFSGAGGEPVSRKETIRAMRRAEVLWPALKCGHRPNDGRQTTRLTAKVEELKDSPIIAHRGLWQRSDRRVGLSL